jgi:hypothetical protein
MASAAGAALSAAEAHAVHALQEGIVEARVLLSRKSDEVAKLQTRLSVLEWWGRAEAWAGDRANATDALAELAAIEAQASGACEQRVTLEQHLAAAALEAAELRARAQAVDQRADRARAAAAEVSALRARELGQLELISARLRGVHQTGARREQLRRAGKRQAEELRGAVAGAEAALAAQGAALAAAQGERAAAEDECRREEGWQAELLRFSYASFAGAGPAPAASRQPPAEERAARKATKKAAKRRAAAAAAPATAFLAASGGSAWVA